MIHIRNLQILATEMFKVYRNISPPIFSEIFHRHNLQINSDFAMPNVKSIFHGSESILYLGPKIWDIVPLELKEFTGFVAFIKGIKSGSQETVNVGYVRNMYPIEDSLQSHHEPF